jgi:hypothetical protein
MSFEVDFVDRRELASEDVYAGGDAAEDDTRSEEVKRV